MHLLYFQKGNVSIATIYRKKDFDGSCCNTYALGVDFNNNKVC